MRRILFSIGAVAVLSVMVWQSVRSQTGPPRQDSSASESGRKAEKAPPRTDHAADEKTIRANIEQFVKAYNAGDAKAVAALFTADGQAVDKDGNESEGRPAIARTFGNLFKALPKRRIEVTVESIRFVGGDLALETGTTKEIPAPGGPAEYDRYTVLHVMREGKWQMALARDEEGPSAAGHERLEPLAWLVGDWIDDGGGSVVTSSCRWSEDGNFLLQEFKLQLDGRDSMKVSQRIGWDPLSKSIHSWMFDSEGGYGESAWTRDGAAWIIKATGVRPDGTTASATNQLVPAGNDSYVWRSVDRIIAGERQPSIEVKVIRKPPRPKQ